MKKLFKDLRMAGIDARLSVNKTNLYHAVQKQKPFAYMLGNDYNNMLKNKPFSINYDSTKRTHDKIVSSKHLNYKYKQLTESKLHFTERK